MNIHDTAPITLGRKVARAIYTEHGIPLCIVDSMGERKKEYEQDVARRMVACWNLCKYLNTEMLERFEKDLHTTLNQAFYSLRDAIPSNYELKGSKGTVFIESYEAVPATVTLFVRGAHPSKDRLHVQHDAVADNHTFSRNLLGREQTFRRHRHIQWIATEPEIYGPRKHATRFVPGHQQYIELPF